MLINGGEQMRANLKTLLMVTMLLALTTLVSCSGGGGSSRGPSGPGSTSGGGSSTSTYGAYSSPNILASEFVAALNSTDGTYSSAGSCGVGCPPAMTTHKSMVLEPPSPQTI